MVMKTVLRSSAHPEYGEVSTPFSIPLNDYERTLKLLGDSGIGDTLLRDCRLVKIDSRYSVLERLQQADINIDKLDYLAKQLDSFDDGEAAQFQAMAHKLDIADVKDFINLTFCCQQATVITNFSDLEQAGREHRLNLNGGAMSMEEYQKLDGRREALQLLQSGKGAVTPYGVVYDNDMKLEALYNGRHFPAYLYETMKRQ